MASSSSTTPLQQPPTSSAAAAAAQAQAQAQDVVSAQAETLRARGYLTRNTFIDEPGEWFEGSRSASRSKSAPPLPAVFVLPSKEKEDQDTRFESMSDRPRMYHKGTSKGSKGSKASTACPELFGLTDDDEFASQEACLMRQAAMASEVDMEEDHPYVERDRGGERSDARSTLSENSAASSFGEGQSRQSVSQSPSIFARFGDDAARELARLVERECGFLRLNGYTMHRHASDRARRKGILITLRFYVRGLPWAKRSRWQQPLFRAVGAVLECHDMTIRMQSGELHVLVGHGHVVRIDFAAGRL